MQVSSRSDVATESYAGGWILCPGKLCDQLLHCGYVFLFAASEVLEVNTRKGTWLFLGTETLVISEREWVCPRHVITLLRLRSMIPGWSFSTAGLVQPRIQPRRAPRPSSRSCILIGRRGMGGCILLPGCWGGCGAGAEFSLAAAEPRVGL